MCALLELCNKDGKVVQALFAARIVKIFDHFAPRLADPNLKVNIHINKKKKEKEKKEKKKREKKKKKKKKKKKEKKNKKEKKKKRKRKRKKFDNTNIFKHSRH